MTKSEKELLQDTHDTVIKLHTIIVGNGIRGLCDQVIDNKKLITKQEKKFDKVYYKLIGGGVVIIAIAELISKVIFR